MNIIGKRAIWFSISGITIILGVLSLALWGFHFGLDFKGGTLIELSFEQKTSVSVDEVKDSLKNLDFAKGLVVQKTGESEVLIRTQVLDNPQKIILESTLNEKIGESRELRLETIGPTVSKDLKQKALIAIILASLAIILYVAWAFRAVPKPANPWHFGFAAILALAHDILVTVGLFSIFGHFLGYEIDSLFITALLTVMGFSVHDTIVVFDRIRENLKRHPNADFEKTVNDSVVQTLARSLNTSFTVILVLLALLLLGGKSIQQFITALLVGITVGTYSSIFTASPLLVIWQHWATKNKP